MTDKQSQPLTLSTSPSHDHAHQAITNIFQTIEAFTHCVIYFVEILEQTWFPLNV